MLSAIVSDIFTVSSTIVNNVATDSASLFFVAVLPRLLSYRPELVP